MEDYIESLDKKQRELMEGPKGLKVSETLHFYLKKILQMQNQHSGVNQRAKVYREALVCATVREREEQRRHAPKHL